MAKGRLISGCPRNLLGLQHHHRHIPNPRIPDRRPGLGMLSLARSSAAGAGEADAHGCIMAQAEAITSKIRLGRIR
jgi:hypothetical protein